MIGAIIVTNSVLNMMSPPSMLNTNTEVNDDFCIISFLIIELQITSDKSFYVISLLIFIVSRQEETRFTHFKTPSDFREKLSYFIVFNKIICHLSFYKNQVHHFYIKVLNDVKLKQHSFSISKKYHKHTTHLL